MFIWSERASPQAIKAFSSAVAGLSQAEVMILKTAVVTSGVLLAILDYVGIQSLLSDANVVEEK
jgi:hypothetical protein